MLRTMYPISPVRDIPTVNNASKLCCHLIIKVFHLVQDVLLVELSRHGHLVHLANCILKLLRHILPSGMHKKSLGLRVTILQELILYRMLPDFDHHLLR